jgi:hypothetical protein
MFKVSFYVEDKSLGEALKRLSGIARNVEHAYVPNLEPKPNGKIHVAASDSIEMFVKEMRKRKLTEINAGKARELCVAMGFSPTSYNYMLKRMLAGGIMKRTGTVQKSIYHLKEEK